MMCPQDGMFENDHVGAMNAAQATHAAEIEHWMQQVRLAAEDAQFWHREYSKLELVTDPRSLERLYARAIEAFQAERDEARAELERVKADPRLQIPLDGPGSHRVDLQELRACQEKLEKKTWEYNHAAACQDSVAASKLELVAELERVKAERDMLNEAYKQVGDQAVQQNAERDGIEAELREDLRSLERLYARAIDAQVQAERARDDARAETQRLLDENRELKKSIRPRDLGDVLIESMRANPLGGGSPK